MHVLYVRRKGTITISVLNHVYVSVFTRVHVKPPFFQARDRKTMVNENCLPVHFSCWCWSVTMKIVYLVPVWFQLLVLGCYNENCLLSACLVSVVGAGVLQ